MGGLAALTRSPGKPARLSIDGVDVDGIVSSVSHDLDGEVTVTILPRVGRFDVSDETRARNRVGTITVDAMLKRPGFIKRNIDDLMGGARCRGTVVALYPEHERRSDEPHPDAPTWCPDCASRLERDVARLATVCPDNGCGYMLTDEALYQRSRA